MITYINGDATNPIGNNKKLIVHVCNNKGKWGKGFVLAISKKWIEPEKNYRALEKYKLGDVNFIKVYDDITVANMISQDGINKIGCFEKKINYIALRKCLEKVRVYAENHNLSIHMPKIGSGLGGGDWNTISKIISDELENLDVFIYEF